ncbi:hypothetical protein SAMN05444411_103302 [Lutibacter oricola]|uniref:Lipoprotein n=1 Tax=Lutibacter oricola TaxID=762486 RepID=A0A1H2ZNY3_9FLAO|nr:DUF6786 family protein [Lutibacter oricola]SDX18544.1 hypothetical protein SAMN05444411_103302 [Lutibacter oricola]
MKNGLIIVFLLLLISCNSSKRNYKSDVDLLKSHTEIIELTVNNKNSRLVITPQFQGKVITSSFNGIKGSSNGWFNTKALLENNIGGIGGEDRVWVGPLGGQYSFYYQQIKPFSEDNWAVPASLSNEPYSVVSSSKEKVQMEKEMSLTNFIGTKFNFKINRTIKLLKKSLIDKNLNIELSNKLKYIAYESSHKLTNLDTITWVKNKGLVSIWSAGMFKGTDQSIVIIPLHKTAKFTDVYKYMGDLDQHRFQIKNNTVLFKVDGKYRSKIGIPNFIAPEIYGCYSKENKRLTIIQYKKTADSLFFNSNAAIQKEPYKGEVIPIYNNGAMDYSKTDIASFYELESTSPFKELKPNEILSHFHRVYHFSGTEKELNKIAIQLLGIRLENCNFNL